MKIVPGSMTTITFDAEGQATGFGGCNDFTVVYEGDLQIEKVMEAEGLKERSALKVVAHRRGISRSEAYREWQAEKK